MQIIFQRIARAFPKLKEKLSQAGLQYKTEDFIKRTFLTSMYMTFGIGVVLFLILSRTEYKFPLILFIPIFIIFLIIFFYMLRMPDALIIKKEKEINKEIVFAGRFLIIELESGINLYEAFRHITKNYETIGKYFMEITNKVDLGTSIEEALDEAVELTPSNNFRRILWQIINSLRTGSNIADSLKAVLEQITREQNIEVQKYGRKLNPLAMFYMMIAVILPSLGITMLIILTSFIGLQLKLFFLLFIVFLLGFVQFMFLAIIRFSRPAVEM